MIKVVWGCTTMKPEYINGIASKAAILGVKTTKLGNYGLVLHKSDEDLLYLTSKTKPIIISKEVFIPEYECKNDIIVVRHIRESMAGYFSVLLKFYFPHSNRQFTLVEIPFLYSMMINEDRKLPRRKHIIIGEPNCSAIILKIDKYELDRKQVSAGEATYIITRLGNRKQISSKYVGVAEAGYDSNYHTRFVLLQMGRSGKQFENLDRLNNFDKEYLNNNYINSIFTDYRLLSPKDKLISKN